jgi:hypothetical protein
MSVRSSAAAREPVLRRTDALTRPFATQRPLKARRAAADRNDMRIHENLRRIRAAAAGGVLTLLALAGVAAYS